MKKLTAENEKLVSETEIENEESEKVSSLIANLKILTGVAVNLQREKIEIEAKLAILQDELDESKTRQVAL